MCLGPVHSDSPVGCFSMAQKRIVTLEDDIDGGPADETIYFAFDGHEYEIDLNTKNAAALRAVFNKYSGTARKVSGSARRGGGARRLTTVQPDVDATAVRAWAGSNGIEVNARGRLSKNLVAQFREAGN
jgi:hypothetical protein